MKIAFVHYTIGSRDGVNNVMASNVDSLRKIYKNLEFIFLGKYVRDVVKGRSRIKYIDFPEQV